MLQNSYAGIRSQHGTVTQAQALVFFIVLSLRAHPHGGWGQSSRCSGRNLRHLQKWLAAQPFLGLPGLLSVRQRPSSTIHPQKMIAAADNNQRESLENRC